jgi:hypothetical protein
MVSGAFCSSRLRAIDDLRGRASLARACSGARARRVAVFPALLIALAACRIYREDASALEAQPGEAAAASAVEPAPARPEADDGLKPGANDALNLWVLNRPEGDLPPHTGERAETAAASARAVERPKATVLVVLGLGDSGADCAEQLAQREATRLAAGGEPLGIVTRSIESLRRARWANAPGELSAVVKGPHGVFGGVDRVPAVALGAALGRAIERRAVLDGQHPRWGGVGSPLAPATPPPGACDLSGPQLAGPGGVLIRTAAGEFFGGIVNRGLPADAGVVAPGAQYGVSLAVGSAGAVLLASDCAMPPDERFAARVYASQSWARATADVSPLEGCHAANAVVTRARAWAAPDGDLAWSAAEAEPEPPATTAADAGAPASERPSR